MRRFGLIFLLICAVFMLCSCESNDDDPVNPNIIVQFGYDYSNSSQQYDYWATVTATTAESWNASVALSVDGTALTPIGIPSHVLVGNIYENVWMFTCGAYTPGTSYQVTLTVDGTATSENITINPLAVLDMTNFPNPYNPVNDATLVWTIPGLPAGTNPDGQAIVGSYAVGQTATQPYLELYPEPEDRSFVIEAGQIESGAAGTLTLEVVTYYSKQATSNSKVTFNYYTSSDPRFVMFDGVVAVPPATRPTIDYRKIIANMRK